MGKWEESNANLETRLLNERKLNAKSKSDGAAGKRARGCAGVRNPPPPLISIRPMAATSRDGAATAV